MINSVILNRYNNSAQGYREYPTSGALFLYPVSIYVMDDLHKKHGGYMNFISKSKYIAGLHPFEREFCNFNNLFMTPESFDFQRNPSIALHTVVRTINVKTFINDVYRLNKKLSAREGILWFTYTENLCFLEVEIARKFLVVVDLVSLASTNLMETAHTFGIPKSYLNSKGTKILPERIKDAQKIFVIESIMFAYAVFDLLNVYNGD